MADEASFSAHGAQSQNTPSPPAPPSQGGNTDIPSAVHLRTMREDLERIRRGESPEELTAPELSAPTTPESLPPMPPPPPPSPEQTPPPPSNIPEVPMPPSPAEHEVFAPQEEPSEQFGNPPMGLPSTPPPPPSNEPVPQEEPILSPDDRLSYGGTEASTIPAESTAPLRPEELLAIEEGFSPEEAPSPIRHLPGPLSTLPLGVTVGLGAVIFIALIGGSFFAISHLFFGKNPTVTPPNLPSTPPVVTPQEPPRPNILLPNVGAQTLTVGAIEEAPVEFQQTLAQRIDPNGFRAVFLKVESSTERRYASLSETVTALGVTIPDTIMATLDTSKFSLFLSGEPDTGVVRPALVIAVRDRPTLTQTLPSWETTLPDNFDALLHVLGELGPPESSGFRSNVRNDVAIRYLNFPDPTVSIDYALAPSQNLLLLGTSRASMYALIDGLP